ncbi:MAG TPA: polysaccharide deacetylase family protein, partial [Bryobacteraceae bacterium]|nr:polysaccharide deacetylase family protein [Bryobacteraceae bacterium]
MVGRNLQQHPGTAAKIAALGHQVGAHTYDHLQLEAYRAKGGDVVRQMALTSNLMPNNADLPYYFRPPYGAWTSDVAAAMNADFLVHLGFFGPIDWDCDGGDWAAWRDGKDPLLTAANYEAEIDRHGKGIVLMHDSSADAGHLRDKNRTLALTRILVPRLKQKGFEVIRLDTVAEIALKAAPPAIALCSANGRYLSLQQGEDGQLFANGIDHGQSEKLKTVLLGSNRVAFRASNGKYLSLKMSPSKSVSAVADKIGDWETFDVMPWPDGRVAFRAFSGGFLSVGLGPSPELLVGELTEYPARSGTFSFFAYS